MATTSTNPSKALQRGLGQGGAAAKLGRVHGGIAVRSGVPTPVCRRWLNGQRHDLTLTLDYP